MDSGFNTILLEQWDENRMAPSSMLGINCVGIANRTNILSSGEPIFNCLRSSWPHAVLFIDPILMNHFCNFSDALVRTVTIESHLNFRMDSQNGSMFRSNDLNNFNDPIEVTDSDDGNDVAENQMQASMDTSMVHYGSTSSLDANNDTVSADGEQNDAIMDIENDDLLLGFGPIEDIDESELNRGVAVAVTIPTQSNDLDHHQQKQQQPQMTPMKMRPKRNAAKRSVCTCCGPTHDDRKKSVQTAQRQLQDNAKPNDDKKPIGTLFECTDCDLKFTKFAFLSTHRTKVHKNGMKGKQRWFHCWRCMRRFANQNDKNWHEMGCDNRRYECYLCKVYVTSQRMRMQNHVRTHSGAKPFPCNVCGKCFGTTTYLARHIVFHNRKK